MAGGGLVINEGPTINVKQEVGGYSDGGQVINQNVGGYSEGGQVTNLNLDGVLVDGQVTNQNFDISPKGEWVQRWWRGQTNFRLLISSIATLGYMMVVL